MLTTELVVGATWRELLDLAAGASATWPARRIFRFVFRSLYRLHAFNGDPHPGNYLFHGDGRVTFLDFGLVKHFTDDEMAHVRRRWSRRPPTTTTRAAFRRIVERGRAAARAARR